jgi:hypothetical protein
VVSDVAEMDQDDEPTRFYLRVVVVVNELTQRAPYPMELANLVDALRYKPGWSFRLVEGLDRGQGGVGLTLVMRFTGEVADV